MPKSKKPRKKHTPKPKLNVVEKMPYCMHCNTVTRMATVSELTNFKAQDPTFDFPFLFLPQCDCWQEHEEWMTL